jgi:O-methyltransferase
MRYRAAMDVSIKSQAAWSNRLGDASRRLEWWARFARDRAKFSKIYRKYAALTMLAEKTYIDNLELAERVAKVDGSIVECGVWRGGMMAGIADVLGANRSYYLYDSFEGLPAPTAIDGDKAITYQESTDDPLYYDNCTASEEEARSSMTRSAAIDYKLVKGWFDQTLPNSPPAEQIALLRLDGDWYESTKCALEHLAPRVKLGGIVIVDDYYYWEGCTRAVNEYALNNNWMIRQTRNGVCFIQR